MSNLRVAARAACCIVALLSGQAMATDAQCWQPHEVEAAKVRDLHIMLMLGALKCKSFNSSIGDKYTAFTDKKIGLLSGYNNVLKTRFMRASGISEGQRAYEEFNTKLGNTHSGNPQTASYCQMVDSLLTLATGAGDAELPMLAQNFSESRMGIDVVCEAAALVKTPEAVPPAGAGSAADPPSATAALEAAAVALQAAAASLKAQAAAPKPQAPEQAPLAKPTAQPMPTAVTTPAG